MNWQKNTTVIIPAFNEEQAIGECIETLLQNYPEIKINIINDGSSDNTQSIAEGLQSKFQHNIKVFNHRINRGYGAALKTGMRNVTTPYLVWFDADFQHDPANLEGVVEPVFSAQVDACLGARTKKSAFVIKRIPGKFILKIISQIVARQRIPDLNCGFRCFRTEVILKYLHLLPDGFSASSTSTLLMIKRNYRIQWFSLTVRERKGQSYVKIFRDGFQTLGLILRIFLLFDALLFFSTLAFVQLLFGVIYSLYMISTVNIGVPVLGALIMISGLLTFFMGLISSQISQMRQERFENQVTNIELSQ